MINLLRSGIIMVLLLSGCGWNGTPTRNNDFTALTSISVSADYGVIARDTSTRLTVTGNFSGLFTRDITDQVAWSSDAPAVAAFTMAAFPSRVKGVGAGNATLTATVGGLSASFPITVSSAAISSIDVSPAAPSVVTGLTQEFKAAGNFSDGTAQDITFDAAWSSTAPGVATVSKDPTGKLIARAVAAGTATISATFDGVVGNAVMTVTQPVLQSIAFSQTNPSILTLSTARITATGTYTDGSTADITSRAAWSSSNTAVATTAGNGTFTTLTQGTTVISAVLDGISQSTTLKTTGGNLTVITVSPAAATLVKNSAADTTVQISAKGTFSNNTSRDITGAVTWAVANTSLATVTPAGGNLAWLNPALAGTTTVTAKSGTLSASTPMAVTVTTPALLSIALSTIALDLTAETGGQLGVIASFSDGTTQDVTTLSGWTSADPAIATVGSSGLAAGRVTGGSVTVVASTTVSATYGGMTVPIPATITVRPRTLQSLTISPLNSTIQAGNQVSFTATANYFDGTMVDVTRDALWAVGSANVAVLADGVNQPGQVMAVDSGLTTVTASFGVKTPKSQTTNVTVVGP
jgi:hypothetical protein